ncbi:hypothetical protein, partial [Pseudomonas batumici]|uniref:hypothetical protein n=1 Tax=Pseudomonas batumici TaxID=226910 RepID=UPI001ADFE3BF
NGVAQWKYRRQQRAGAGFEGVFSHELMASNRPWESRRVSLNKRAMMGAEVNIRSPLLSQ